MPRALSLAQLERISYRLRRNVLKMIRQAGSGHPAGSLSAIEILTALYFGGILRYDSNDPEYDSRDHLIISNGHISATVYAVLAEAKFFDPQKLDSFRSMNSALQGHVNKNVDGVEVSTGLLGQGLSVAVGLALGNRDENGCIFCLMSDGEQQEGQVWEAAMSASKYCLDNLIAIVDCNKIQVDGMTDEIMPLGSLKAKYESFGWKAYEVDGNDYRQLIPAICQAKEHRHQPKVVLAQTIAGYGVKFMENNPEWHGRGLTKEEYKQALRDLKDHL